MNDLAPLTERVVALVVRHDRLSEADPVLRSCALAALPALLEANMRQAAILLGIRQRFVHFRAICHNAS